MKKKYSAKIALSRQKQAVKKLSVSDLAKLHCNKEALKETTI